MLQRFGLRKVEETYSIADNLMLVLKKYYAFEFGRMQLAGTDVGIFVSVDGSVGQLAERVPFEEPNEELLALPYVRLVQF